MLHCAISIKVKLAASLLTFKYTVAVTPVRFIAAVYVVEDVVDGLSKTNPTTLALTAAVSAYAVPNPIPPAPLGSKFVPVDELPLNTVNDA